MNALFLAAVLAAPALKEQGGHVEGELIERFGEAAVVRVDRNDGTGERDDYWLVFTSAESEKTTAKFAPGERVRVTGQLGQGGIYRYVIVSKIESLK